MTHRNTILVASFLFAVAAPACFAEAPEDHTFDGDEDVTTSQHALSDQLAVDVDGVLANPIANDQYRQMTAQVLKQHCALPDNAFAERDATWHTEALNDDCGCYDICTSFTRQQCAQRGVAPEFCEIGGGSGVDRAVCAVSRAYCDNRCMSICTTGQNDDIAEQRKACQQSCQLANSSGDCSNFSPGGLTDGLGHAGQGDF